MRHRLVRFAFLFSLILIAGVAAAQSGAQLRFCLRSEPKTSVSYTHLTLPTNREV